MREFRYVGENSSKFWKVHYPESTPGGNWMVRVNYGRIGTWGQDHTNIFSMKPLALSHYHKKISEKLKKGYKELKQDGIHKPLKTIKPKKVECLHDSLTRTGNKFQCTACKKVVEFNQPKIEPVESTARRFFNLSWRKTA